MIASEKFMLLTDCSFRFFDFFFLLQKFSWQDVRVYQRSTKRKKKKKRFLSVCATNNQAAGTLRTFDNHFANMTQVQFLVLFLVVCSLFSTLATTCSKNALSLSLVNLVEEHSTKVGTSRRSRILPSNRLFQIRGGYAGDSGVLHITSADEFNQIVKGSANKLIVIDFSATWCMPCKMIAPAFEELSNPSGEFGNVVFIKIDVDEVPDLAEKYQVQAMPTFLFLRGDKEIDRFSGASVEKLRQTIMNHSSS